MKTLVTDIKKLNRLIEENDLFNQNVNMHFKNDLDSTKDQFYDALNYSGEYLNFKCSNDFYDYILNNDDYEGKPTQADFDTLLIDFEVSIDHLKEKHPEFFKKL